MGETVMVGQDNETEKTLRMSKDDEEVTITMSRAEFEEIRSGLNASWQIVVKRVIQGMTDLGGVAPMKDDPREFDWAEKQINKLKERVARLEKVAEREASTESPFPRIAQLEEANKATRDIDFSHARHIGEAQELLATHTRLIEEHQTRLEALEAPVFSGNVPATITFGGAKVDFSPPVGGLSSRLDHLIEEQTMAETKPERYNTLRHAEVRIREYMKGHFSEATTNAVVDALWNRQP